MPGGGGCETTCNNNNSTRCIEGPQEAAVALRWTLEIEVLLQSPMLLNTGEAITEG